ncbi:MAG: hypothetical protein JNM74_20225, partial [Myxococcales bacterium]|nr:hypothetical protein [Myxococcales bacterium]
MKRTRTPLSYLGTALGGLVSLALASSAAGCKKAKPTPTEASGHTTVGARVPTPTA